MAIADIINKLKEPHRLASLGFGLGSIIAGTAIRTSDFGFVLMGAGVTAVGMTLAGMFNPVHINVNPAHVPETYRAEESWKYGAGEETSWKYGAPVRPVGGSEGLMTAGGAAWNVMRAGVAHVPEIYRANTELMTSGGAAWAVNRSPVVLHHLSAVEGSGSIIGQ